MGAGLHDTCPLVVDMDDTLLATDSLLEGLYSALGRDPSTLFRIPGWLKEGRLNFKLRLLDCPENIAVYPLNQAVVDFLKKERDSGREIFLATASPMPVAAAIAERVGIFSGVFASDAGVNLKGSQKADYLEKRFGKQGFDYMADSKCDLPIWKIARNAIVVDSPSLAEEVGKITGKPAISFISRQTEEKSATVLREIRVRQWIKNILVFVPIFLAHAFSPEIFLSGFLAFFSLSLCASAIYVMNDVLDLGSDRIHPIKCHRPFASGKLNIRYAFPLFSVCLAGSFFIALFLPTKFFLLLFIYLLLTLMYSFFLKRILLVDVFTLAVLYVLRVIMGGAATGIIISNWLFAFMICFFLGLAVIKRTSDSILQSNCEKPSGRAYLQMDLPILEMIAVGSCFSSMIILCLYIDSDQSSALYSNPFFLWAICPLLLYWYLRLILLAHRGKVLGDPIAYALKDTPSYLILMVIFICFLLAC